MNDRLNLNSNATAPRPALGVYGGDAHCSQACRTRYACSNNADAAAGRVTMPRRRSSSTTDKPSSARVAARVARIAGELGLLQLRKARGVDVAIRSVKFRRAFVRLGPAFVKIGQALATRRDVLPPELCDELSRLQDDIDPSLSGAEAVRVIEHDLEKPIGELFEGLDASSVPVASASLGQVYRARLLTGEEVAVKVQRDDVLETLAIDAVAVRSFVAMLSQLFSTETDFAAIADEIVGRISDELDYAREASDCELFAHLYKNEDVCVPKVYREFCGPRVLTSPIYRARSSTSGAGPDPRRPRRSASSRRASSAPLGSSSRSGFSRGPPPRSVGGFENRWPTSTSARWTGWMRSGCWEPPPASLRIAMRVGWRGTFADWALWTTRTMRNVVSRQLWRRLCLSLGRCSGAGPCPFLVL